MVKPLISIYFLQTNDKRGKSCDFNLHLRTLPPTLPCCHTMKKHPEEVYTKPKS